MVAAGLPEAQPDRWQRRRMALDMLQAVHDLEQ
jgi:hypothetical protein